MGGLTDLGGITPHPTPTPTRVSEFLETVNNWLGGGACFSNISPPTHLRQWALPLLPSCPRPGARRRGTASVTQCPQVPAPRPPVGPWAFPTWPPLLGTVSNNNLFHGSHLI